MSEKPKEMNNVKNNSFAWCLRTVNISPFKPKREKNSKQYYARENPQANAHSKVKGYMCEALSHSTRVKVYEFTANVKKFYLKDLKKSALMLLSKCENFLQLDLKLCGDRQ